MSNINYKAFFQAANDKVFFNSPHGYITTYELFDLNIEDLVEMYRQIKKKLAEFYVDLDIEPIVVDNKDKRALEIQADVLRSIISYKQESAKKEQLRKKKEQLKRMLEEIKLRQLQEDPDKLQQEIEKLSEMLGEDN